MNGMSISVNEKWLQTYLTNALGSFEDCYIGQVLKYGQADLVVTLTALYLTNEEIYWCSPVVGRNVHEISVETSCLVCYVQS